MFGRANPKRVASTCTHARTHSQACCRAHARACTRLSASARTSSRARSLIRTSTNAQPSRRLMPLRTLQRHLLCKTHTRTHELAHRARAQNRCEQPSCFRFAMRTRSLSSLVNLTGASSGLENVVIGNKTRSFSNVVGTHESFDHNDMHT